MIIRDDLGIPEKAQAVDRELIKAGVLAIIGHATSQQTMAGLKVTDPAKVVLLGPTVSTPANEFQSLGGKIAGEVSFSSVAQPDFSPLLSKLRLDKAEGLLIIASDIDTALVAQRTRILGWQIPLFSSAWAPTETLINNGGQAVEGITIEQSYALTSQSPAFLDFETRYQKRFGHAPSFGATLTYDAAMVLAAALENTGGKGEELKHALLEIGDFRGLMDTFSFDHFGDVKRPIYLSSIVTANLLFLIS